ncbi:MAG: sugar phosphate isomerase/epimerase, partial [Clostridia bacterium]|nr:sugar phosphate isomerase/epimerase [Clostridia bacterium]
GQSAGGGFKLNLNSKEIFDGAYYFDMESGDVVISVPKLASQAFRVNVFENGSDSEYGYGESGRTVIQSVIPALSSAKPYVPDQELLERIRDRYKDLIIENLEDLSRADEELSAGGISEKYTVITVKLTEKTVKKVVKAVLKELKGDKDVKEFLKGSYDSLAGIVKSVPDASADFPADFDEFYEKFRDFVDDRLGEVDEGELDMGSKTPAVRICVDSEGVVKGLTFKADDVDVSLLIAEKGDDHALEFNENDLIEATLKWSDGSKKAFDLKIVNDGDEILRARFDGKDSNGAVTGEGSLEIAGKEPAFGILWDVQHSDKTCRDDWESFYTLIKPYVRHIHFKDHLRDSDPPFKLVSVGEGDIPLKAIVDRLLADGYDGYFSLEWEKKWHPDLADPEIEFPHFAELMKSYN